MLSEILWRIALAVVCALVAGAVVVVALVPRRRRSHARIALSVMLAGALLIIGAAPLIIGAAPLRIGSTQTLTSTLATPGSVANHTAPVAAGLTVYAVTGTAATSDTLVALSARTGAIRWSRVFAKGVVTIRARGPMDVIVSTSKFGATGYDIMALRASDGTTLWQRPLEGGDRSMSPTPMQPVLPLDATGAASSPLYVLTAQPSPQATQSISGFTALRASDGAVLWQDTAPVSAPIRYSNPVITPSVIIFESSRYLISGVTGDMDVLAVDATTGQPIWTTRIQQGPTATRRDIVADTSAAYAATYDTASQKQEIEALRLTDGKVLWRATIDPTNGLLGVTGSGGVMAATQTKVIALAVASGKTLWTAGRNASAGADVALQADGSAPLVHANTVYFTAEVGNTYPLQPMLYAVDTATGATRWTYHIDSIGLGLQWKNARVYILGGKDGVTALDDATGAMRWRLTASSGLGNPEWTVGGLGTSDWTAASDTVFLLLEVNTPPRPGHICEGGVLYPLVWALSSEDGSSYWRTLIAKGHAYGSTGCA